MSLSEEKNRFVFKPAKESVADGSFIFFLPQHFLHIRLNLHQSLLPHIPEHLELG